MNKLIGGLLVVSMLSKPSLLGVTYVAAYEVLKNENKIVCVVKKEDQEQLPSKNTNEITKLLASVEDDGRTINTLLKERGKVTTRIEANLDLYKYAGISLKENQMDSFSTYLNFSNKENSFIAHNISSINEKKDLNEVKKELLQYDTNFYTVYSSLNDINSHQKDVISSLRKVITNAEEVLTVL